MVAQPFQLFVFQDPLAHLLPVQGDRFIQAVDSLVNLEVFGVEAGQVAFVFVVLLLISLTRPLAFQFPKWSYKIPAYLIGTLAMYWFIERTITIF